MNSFRNMTTHDFEVECLWILQICGFPFWLSYLFAVSYIWNFKNMYSFFHGKFSCWTGSVAWYRAYNITWSEEWTAVNLQTCTKRRLTCQKSETLNTKKFCTVIFYTMVEKCQKCVQHKKSTSNNFHNPISVFLFVYYVVANKLF
jgi:hypothetical protein